MTSSLESLLLSESEMQDARKKIEELAYLKWQKAGSPKDHGIDFWLEAEREWIAYYYVPDRYLNHDSEP